MPYNIVKNSIVMREVIRKALDRNKSISYFHIFCKSSVAMKSETEHGIIQSLEWQCNSQKLNEVELWMCFLSGDSKKAKAISIFNTI